MAKKKPARSGGKKSGNGLGWWLAIAVVVIIILAGQLQEKDKKLSELTGPAKAAKQETSGQEGLAQLTPKQPSAPDLVKIKSSVEGNLGKLIGKAPAPGMNWFLDDIKPGKNDTVKISYEDGHSVGSVTYKVVDPADARTWIKQ